MADSTPNLDLYLPGGGSTGLIVPDETADIDPLNENFRKIDTAVGDPDEQNRQWYGPAADIATLPVSPKDGDTYRESDGSKRLWIRLAGVWVSNEGGAYLIRPTVSGADLTVEPDGSLKFAATAAGGVHIEDCFSDRFQNYQIIIEGTHPGNSSIQFQMRVGGVTTTPGGTDYKNQYLYNVGTTPTAVQNDIGFFATSAAGGQRISSRVLFTNPKKAVPTQFIADTVVLQGTGPSLVQSRIAGHHAQSVAYTGLTVTQPSAQTFTGTMRIYGLA